MSACTVADVIGEDYKGWKDKESVFISAPTGSGKTYFVLNTLLPYFSKAHKKILYLVNRQILKKQIEDEVDNLPIEQRESIKVVSYQSIERDILLTEKDSLKEDKLPLDFGYQRLKKFWSINVLYVMSVTIFWLILITTQIQHFLFDLFKTII